jgi:hypothetical protein
MFSFTSDHTGAEKCIVFLAGPVSWCGPSPPSSCQSDTLSSPRTVSPWILLGRVSVQLVFMNLAHKQAGNLNGFEGKLTKHTDQPLISQPRRKQMENEFKCQDWAFKKCERNIHIKYASIGECPNSFRKNQLTVERDVHILMFWATGTTGPGVWGAEDVICQPQHLFHGQSSYNRTPGLIGTFHSSLIIWAALIWE